MKFAVIGDPIAHSLSPRMHEAAYAALGLDHSYEAIRVPAEEFATAMDQLLGEGFEGLNVTIPLKEHAAQWSTPDRFAAQCGAVNTLRLSTRQGINTDAPGMVKVLQGYRWPVPTRVLLLGAGGTARALALALHQAQLQVDLWNRTPAKAHAIAREIGCRAEDDPNLADYHLVLNATKSSMDGELPQVVKDQLPFLNRNASMAMDLYYAEGGTVFQHTLEAMGWKVLDGRELLVAQGALSLEFWLGIPAPLEAMRAAVGL